MSRFLVFVDRSSGRDLAAMLGRAESELCRGGSREHVHVLVQPPFAGLALTHDPQSPFRQDPTGISLAAGFGPEQPADWAFVDACRAHLAEGAALPELPPGPRGRRAFVRWSAQRGELLVISEPNGQLPLHVLHASHATIVSSEAKGIWALETLHPDRDGLADMMTLGHCLGSRTLFAEVRCLEPGRVHRFASGSPVRREYYTPPFEDRLGGGAEGFAGALNDALLDVLASYRPLVPEIGIALSGGMDSRYLLAGARRIWPRLEAVTFGEPEATDVQIARELVRRTGTPAVRYRPAPTFLRDWAPYAVWRSDGMLSCLHAHGMDALIAFAERRPRVLNGMGGDHLTGAFLRPDHVLRPAEPTRAALAVLAARRFHGAALEQVLKADWLPERPDVTERTLIEILSRQPYDRMGNLLSAYWLRHYSPRITAIGIALEQPFLEPVAPLVDPAFVQAAARMPLDLRFMSRAYRRALGNLAPELADVRWERSGAAPRHGWVFHALGRAARRLGRAPRPAIDHGHHLRTTLLPWVRGLLLEPRTIAHGCFRFEYLTALVEDLARGRGRSAEVAMAITIELWRRMYVDRETEAVNMPGLPAADGVDDRADGLPPRSV